jgi:naphthoate synthase
MDGAAVAWQPSGTWQDIRYETAEGIAKITIDRPEVRNAFRPETVVELSRAFELAREDTTVGVVILTGEGPDAFCSGGDQRVRGDSGYVGGEGVSPEGSAASTSPTSTSRSGACPSRWWPWWRLRHRRRPRPPRHLRPHHRRRQRPLRPDRAQGRQLRRWLRRERPRRPRRPEEGQGDLVPVPAVRAEEALAMGLVNTVVPLAELEAETVRWCREMLALSPFSLRLLKASFNAAEDGLAGIQQLAHDANLLFYMSEEAQEGRNAYREKRAPDFGAFPRRP